MQQQPYYTSPQAVEVPGYIAEILAAHSLGRALALYQAPKGSGPVALIIVGLILTLTTLCSGFMLGNLFLMFNRNNGSLIHDPGVLLLGLLIVGAILLGIVMIGFGLRRLSSPPRRIYLCDEGLVLDEKKGIEPLRWSDIASVSHYWISRQRQRNGAHQSDYRTYFTYHCTLLRKDGQERTIDEDDFTDGPILGAEIVRQVTRVLFPQALAAYQMGQMLSFGELSVSKQGLSIDQGRSGVPWPAISSIWIGASPQTRDEMVIMLHQGTSPQKWYAHRHIPNAALFLEIARIEGIQCEQRLQLPNTFLKDMYRGMIDDFLDI